MAKNNFRGMPGGMNQAAMMKQAQKMQQELIRMQQEQETKTYTATAGGGMVSATVSGKHELVDLKIKEEAVDAILSCSAAGAGGSVCPASRHWRQDRPEACLPCAEPSGG